MRLKGALRFIPHISLISSIAKKKKNKAYLVGGFLRDIYLKKRKDLRDFDFCIEKNTFDFAKEFKKLTSSKLIILDEEKNCYRVVLKNKDKIYTYDFTEIKGQTLKEDLLTRDFVINTLSVDITNLPKVKVLDIYGARRDLEKKVIRVLHGQVLKDDPLRILRAFSFSVNYGFHIEKKTEALLKKSKKLLKNVSGERINEELFKILDSVNSFRAIKKMSQLYIIDEIIPYISQQRGVFQGPYHHRDVWGHSLETLFRFELLYQRRLVHNKEIIEYLNRDLTNKHKLIHILKLACLLHDIGKPLAKNEKDKKTIFHTHEKIGRDLVDEIATKIRLSFKEKETLKRLIFWHLRPGYLADQFYPSQRAIYRFFRDTQDEGLAVILLSVSDWRATRGPLVDTKKRVKHERVMFKLVNYYFKERKKRPLPKLVDGFDIMRRFKLEPSPLIGKILKKIREEQALGRIVTKIDGYRVAKRMVGKK